MRVTLPLFSPFSLLALLLPLIAACADDKGVAPIDDSAEPGDSDSGVDTDTEPQGTDDDGDGWTVEEGDCDDANIYVNPAWPEDLDDGVDTDCDGRVDEQWSGFTVAYTDSAGGGSLLFIDTLGDADDELRFDSTCYPAWIDHGVEGGWVVNNGYAAVSLIDEGGGCTDLSDFSESEFGVYGIATHPDGYYVATGLDALYKVAPDGETEVLASWNADTSDTEGFELLVYTVAVDLRDGTVGLFDYYGGFATYNADDGLVIYKKADLTNITQYTLSGAARDGGGWAAMAVGASGGFGVYDFDLAAGAWTQLAAWTDDQRTPSQMTVEGDSSDAYAISNTGQRGRVWRVRYETGEIGTLYESSTDADKSFTAIVANYE